MPDAPDTPDSIGSNAAGDPTDPLVIRQAYAAARSRIIGLVRADDGDRWRNPAPACPGWTARDVLAHLAANTTDALAGRLTGPPSDETTAQQVADRRDRPTAELADEWEANGAIDDVIESMGVAVVALAVDAITHEGDIRGALGEGRPPEDAVSFHLHFGAAGFSSRIAGTGVDGVKMTTGRGTTVAGDDPPGVTLEADHYELSRALLGRRSASQVAAFEWSADPAPYLDRFSPFGLAEHPVVD